MLSFLVSLFLSLSLSLSLSPLYLSLSLSLSVYLPPVAPQSSKSAPQSAQNPDDEEDASFSTVFESPPLAHPPPLVLGGGELLVTRATSQRRSRCNRRLFFRRQPEPSVQPLKPLRPLACGGRGNSCQKSREILWGRIESQQHDCHMICSQKLLWFMRLFGPLDFVQSLHIDHGEVSDELRDVLL